MTKILAIQGSDPKKVNIKTDTTILLASEAQKRGNGSVFKRTRTRIKHCAKK